MRTLVRDRSLRKYRIKIKKKMLIFEVLKPVMEAVGQPWWVTAPAASCLLTPQVPPHPAGAVLASGCSLYTSRWHHEKNWLIFFSSASAAFIFELESHVLKLIFVGVGFIITRSFSLLTLGDLSRIKQHTAVMSQPWTTPTHDEV